MLKKEYIDKISNLSRISIEEERQEEMVNKFNDIIRFVDKIKSAETSNINQKIGDIKKNVLRKDKIKQGIGIEEVQRLSPKFSSGHIVVPAVT